MFRLFRMMKVEGRYVEAFTLFDDVIREQKSILNTAAFGKKAEREGEGGGGGESLPCS
jgi:hypothetical protein